MVFGVAEKLPIRAGGGYSSGDFVALSSGYRRVWYGVRMMLSVVRAPLTLFPPAVTAVAQVLPFRFTLSFPIAILLGRPTPIQALEGLALQIGWLLVFIVTAHCFLATGPRSYSAVGA